MTESLIEQTAKKIYQAHEAMQAMGDSKELILKTTTALLTQYTEAVISRDQENPNGSNMIAAQNELRAWQRQGAGLSHGEKETNA